MAKLTNAKVLLYDKKGRSIYSPPQKDPTSKFGKTNRSKQRRSLTQSPRGRKLSNG